MSDEVKFGIFDKESETEIDSRMLPHWFQPGVAIFITFRTADSMPAHVVAGWESDVRQWLAAFGIVISPRDKLPSWESLPAKLQSEYRRQRDRLWHWQLDSCHGDCVLRDRELAQIVLDSLLFFNGQRYDLASAIIMPNHVHVLVQFRPPTTCRSQCRSWLHWTAHEINRRLKRSGAFWQEEPFDHLVRSETQFHYLQKYIADNGVRANLPETDWLHWATPIAGS